MCSYTHNMSHEAVKIVKIHLMAEKFNQICPKKWNFFAKNSRLKVFEKILASVGTIWHLIAFGIR